MNERNKYLTKNGFTIAETLIVIGIIGIIALLSMPLLVATQKKQMYASTLSVAIANFNTAMNSMIIKEGVDSLFDTEAWRNCKVDPANNNGVEYNLNNVPEFVTALSKTLSINGYENIGNGNNEDNTLSYATLSNPTNRTEQINNVLRIKTKNGVEYQIRIDNDVTFKAERTESETLVSGYTYTNKAADVFIDINGADNSPNIIGRDLFKFELSSDGFLYPYYCKDFCFYHDGNVNNYEDSADKCNASAVNENNGANNSQEPSDYCAAYLAENGYKMDY